MASTTASHMNPDQAEHPPLHQDVGLPSLTVYHRFRFTDLLATRASGPHPFPFRTRSLSPTAPMVLRSRERGRVGHRRLLTRRTPTALRGGRSSFQPRPLRYLCPMTRAGIVTVAGKPNAGKSTLLNRIVGQKLSIVSAKPQSTRNRIVGIRTEGDVQLIVLDTPGLLDPAYPLQHAMRATSLRA